MGQVQAPTAASEDEEQDDVVLIREPKHDEVDTEAQADFDREFAKMLVDTSDARRGERKNAPPIFDTAVPLIRRKAEDSEGDLSKMAFTLLSKRGNKPQVRIHPCRSVPKLTEADALTGYPGRLSYSCQLQVVPAPKQGGTRAAQAPGPAERAQTGDVRVAMYVRRCSWV